MIETIKVDPQALRELAGRLYSIESDLASAETHFNDDGSIASGVIDDALEEFCGAWSRSRSRLLQQLQGAGAFLHKEATEMQKIDDDLKRFIGEAETEDKGRGGSSRGNGSRSTGGPAPAVVVPNLADYDHAQTNGQPLTGRGFNAKNCTDYTAWAINRMLDEQGVSWDFSNRMTRMADGSETIAGGENRWGHGYMWLKRAEDLGFSTGQTPRAGAVAYWDATPKNEYGHVAMVRSFDGEKLVLDSYNGFTGKPLEVTYRKGDAGWPDDFIYVVPGTEPN